MGLFYATTSAITPLALTRRLIDLIAPNSASYLLTALNPPIDHPMPSSPSLTLNPAGAQSQAHTWSPAPQLART
jgi:hypothetical protein